MPSPDLRALNDRILAAWASVPAPSAERLAALRSGYGHATWKAFAGVAPNDVDVESPGFLAATPLHELPDDAGAAYLGAFLRGLVLGLDEQVDLGLFTDFVTRAHTLAALGFEPFWDHTRPHLSPACLAALVEVAHTIRRYRLELAVPHEDAERIVALAEAAARTG